MDENLYAESNDDEYLPIPIQPMRLEQWLEHIYGNDKLIQLMPTAFQQKYPYTRAIFDATEIFIQRPSDRFGCQSTTWSSYKHHSTAKDLIVVAPFGGIMFASKLYTLVPYQITEELVIQSGVLDYIEEGDDIMADRGFTIDDLLDEKKATLNMPPLKNSKAYSYQNEKS